MKCKDKVNTYSLNPAMAIEPFSVRQNENEQQQLYNKN